MKMKEVKFELGAKPQYCDECGGVVVAVSGKVLKEHHLECRKIKLLRRIAEALESLAAKHGC